MATTTLADTLLEHHERPRIVAEVSQIVEGQVASRGGISGMALKTGLKMAKKSRPDAIPNAVDRLLPELCEVLEPHYKTFQASGESSFSKYVDDRADVIRDEIVHKVDARAANSSNKTFTGTYAKLRGTAQDEVLKALPKIAGVLEQHLPG